MLLETIHLALTAIWRNALRSILTLLGVTIGVAAVIAMTTLGQGATAEVGNSIAGLGTNLLVMRPGHLTTGAGAFGIAAFGLDDVEAIDKQIASINVVAPIAVGSLTATAGTNNHYTSVYGVDNRFLAARKWALAEGREFRDGELAAGTASCIVGKAAADELFGEADPLDQTIRLKSLLCKVVGILEEKGASLGSNQDDVILMPIRTFQRRIAGNHDVSVIYLAAASEQAITQVQKDVTALMRDRRHLNAREEDDFVVMDMREVSSMLGTVTGILTGVLAAIAGISLLVGGIGIMNIMLVSVTERTREIGIRLAIGAREGQVLAQFLVEAVALSLLGGFFGVVVGTVLAWVATAVLHIPFVFDPLSMLLAFAFSAVVGVGFGYFPARGAARLNPIEALRHE
jgi:putative ABC transport system permease protein